MFSGVVEKVDAKGNVVVVKGTMMQEKKTLAFDVNDKTRIWRGEMRLHIRDLERTMQVRVEYKQDRDRLTALTIEITDR
jgi:ribosomal protein L24